MPEFKNMNELINYLSEKELETQELKRHIISLQEGQKILEQKLAKRKEIKTNLLSPKFLKRAFAVWGHFIIANLIIGIPWIIYTIYTMLKVVTQITPIIDGRAPTPTP